MASSCVSGIRMEDEGMYRCTVANQFGRDDAEAFISITGIGEYVPVT